MELLNHVQLTEAENLGGGGGRGGLSPPTFDMLSLPLINLKIIGERGGGGMYISCNGECKCASERVYLAQQVCSFIA